MKTMAEVIQEELRKGSYQMPGETLPYEAQANAIAAQLAAAGYGPVNEAAASGVRSVVDIWAGGGGRRTVRIAELYDAARTILAGEWADHIKWNMGDIRREQERRARADKQATP